MLPARSLRRTAIALAAAILPATTAAQTATPAATDVSPRTGFDNSWFWGAKGGVVRFGTITEGTVAAPMAGAEWLVTRRRAALLVTAEQAFYDRTSAVFDAGVQDGVRGVAIQDARRYGAALLAFPTELGPVRPYAGLGIALEVIRSALPMGDFADMGQMGAVADRIDAGQSRTAAYFVGGAQVQFGRVAAFLQGTASAAQRRSLWNQGGAAQLEAGIRLNMSSAIED